MKHFNLEKENLYGAVATFNADPFCIETDEELEDVWPYINAGCHLIVNCDDYDVAVAQLNLDPNHPYEIYETDDYMLKFCIL